MADNVTLLDSSEQEKTIATKELAGGVHANKVILITETGHTFGYHDDEIIFPVQVTEDIFHYAVHEGVAFNASVQGSADLHICFTTGPTNPFHLLWSFGGIGACKMNVWEGVTAGGSTADQIAYCSNRVATMKGRGTSTCLAGNSATVGSIQHGVAATGGTQINAQGFFSAKGETIDNASEEMVLELSTTYYFHLEELSSSAQNGMTLRWFEVPINP